MGDALVAFSVFPLVQAAHWTEAMLGLESITCFKLARNHVPGHQRADALWALVLVILIQPRV